MNSNKIITEELSRMKSLFGYKRGKVVSEQEIQELGIGAAYALSQQNPRTTPSGYNLSQTNTSSSTTPPPIPTELKDIEGVKKFQDWLDEKKQGWAKGYANGVLNKLGKGYGRMGPRTSKAWNEFKDEYLNPQKLTQDITQDEINRINAGTETKDVAATNAPLMKAGEKASDYYRNPDGTIKVNDLEPVVVSAKRKAQAQPTATAQTTVSPNPPDEPGQPGEYRDGWTYDEKSQQWYKPQ